MSTKSNISSVVSSSVFKKYLMAISGLGLVGFIITHLAANLLLLKSDGTDFNAYAHQLASLGGLLYAAEIGLLGLAILHVIVAFALTILKKSARPQGYATYRTKGGPSKAGLSANYMIVSGVVLLVFLVLHVIHFKYGPGISEGYATTIKGEEARDLHRFVVEEFQKPVYVALYVAVMMLLGLHLRHGFWSAFQSLGAMNSKYAKPVYTVGLALALILSVGFLGIPIWIYFNSAN